MKGKSNQFRHESLQDTSAIVKYLHALADGIEKGSLEFRDQSGELELELGGMIRFGVNAERKSERNGLTIKLSWKRSRPKKKDSGPLVINGLAEADDEDEREPTESRDSRDSAS